MVRGRRALSKVVARSSIALSCLALSAFASNEARADASPADKAAAQTLFDEGRRLMAAGKLADACPKLAESQKLDPGVGTQFHLSDCYERLGQTASAWAGFLEVAAAAKSAGQNDREKVARDRAAALAPRLSKLTITAADGVPMAGLEVKRDGAPIGRALWGTAINVDPGSHRIEVTAPGKKPWQTTAQVGSDHDSVVVTIPALENAPPEAEPAALPPPAALSAGTGAGGKGRRTLGLIVGGVGIVGLGIGTAFAISAKAAYDDSLTNCNDNDQNLCKQEGVTRRDEARSAGNVATVAVGVGAAALVAGAVLYLTAPSGEGAHAVVVPTAGPNGAGLSLVGRY
jgi:serine/threonine-protein kinase